MNAKEKKQYIAEAIGDIINKTRDNWHTIEIHIGNTGDAPANLTQYNKTSIQWQVRNKDNSTTGNIILLEE